MQQKLDDIYRHPVEAGLVAEAEHYLYSSAMYDATGKGATGQMSLYAIKQSIHIRGKSLLLP